MNAILEADDVSTGGRTRNILSGVTSSSCIDFIPRNFPHAVVED
jgi:hypothetical protein